MAPFCFSGGGGGGGGAVDLGWQRLNFTGGAVTTEDPQSHVASIDESGPTSVVTLNTAITGIGTHPVFKHVAIRALEDANGNAITFNKPFNLMILIEVTAITGDFGSANEAKPMMGIGITDSASDLDSGNTEYMSAGWDQHATVFPGNGKWGRGNKGNYGTSGTFSNSDTRYITAQFYVGPDQDTATAQWVRGSAHTDVGDLVATSPQTHDVGGTNMIGGTGQVYIFAYVGSRIDVSLGSGSVITGRLFYMVSYDDDGWTP